MSQVYLSIVSPVYKAENILHQLVIEIHQHLVQITEDYEIILVDDGSPDHSWQRIEAICQTNPKVKGIKLSRNFGQHYAITAGLTASSGEWIVVMDCDLQDNPIYIPQMLEIAKTKQKLIVLTKKKSRKHSIFKNITARLFFRVFNYLADNQRAAETEGSFSLLHRKVANAFLQIKDVHRHYLLIVRWLGFNIGYLQIEHRERYEGKSSYTFRKLVRHAIDGITSQSVKLLRISISIGFLFVFLFFCYALYVLIQYFTKGALAGWTSLTLLVLLSTGLILIAIGIMGIYIGKIFEQTKGRPFYFIQKKINF